MYKAVSQSVSNSKLVILSMCLSICRYDCLYFRQFDMLLIFSVDTYLFKICLYANLLLIFVCPFSFKAFFNYLILVTLTFLWPPTITSIKK